MLERRFEKIYVNGRIVGVQRIREIHSLKTTFYVSMMLCAVYTLWGLSLIFFARFNLYKYLKTSKISKDISSATKVENMGFFVIVLSMILIIWTFKRYRNRAALRRK